MGENDLSSIWRFRDNSIGLSFPLCFYSTIVIWVIWVPNGKHNAQKFSSVFFYFQFSLEENHFPKHFVLNFWFRVFFFSRLLLPVVFLLQTFFLCVKAPSLQNWMGYFLLSWNWEGRQCMKVITNVSFSILTLLKVIFTYLQSVAFGDYFQGLRAAVYYLLIQMISWSCFKKSDFSSNFSTLCQRGHTI